MTKSHIRSLNMECTLYLDIETIPGPEVGRDAITVKAPAQYKKPESIQKWLAENTDTEREQIYRKQSFNGGYGQICSIAWAVDDGFVGTTSLGVRDAERDMLGRTLAHISTDLGGSANPTICGHFVSGFDLKFIMHRCVVLGVEMPQWLASQANKAAWQGRIRDTMFLWAGAKGTISLDELCKILGIEGKGDIDGSMVYDMWLAGKHDEIASYCSSDVEKVRDVDAKFRAAGL
jgi:predicted PolB exonuclease-like 3'-5' exonuclease